VQLNSTEISLLHNQAVRSAEDQAEWPQTSDEDSREKDMLTLIANELAGAMDYSSVSLLAQNIGGEPKVNIVTPEVADPFIQVKLSFDRAWASILYSVNRGGFQLIDQNRSEGTLFVNYTDLSMDEPGFFRRWFGESSDEILEINYRVLVQIVGADVEVRIVGRDAEGLTRVEALRLLKILRNNMS
jgi:outer membrane protein assembly factor BamC